MSDVLAYAHVLLQAIYVFCVCYAIVSDFTRLTIPNWIPVVLVAAFALFALLYIDASSLLRHLYVAGAVFALGVGFFVAGWIGGGDVKFLTAVTLWAGAQAAPTLVIIMAVLGAGLAAALFTANRYADQLSVHAPRNRLLARVLELAQSGRCPYGVAIGIAALVPGMAPIWQAPAAL
jgi:prepilin peptidase CpaA